MWCPDPMSGDWSAVLIACLAMRVTFVVLASHLLALNTKHLLVAAVVDFAGTCLVLFA